MDVIPKISMAQRPARLPLKPTMLHKEQPTGAEQTPCHFLYSAWMFHAFRPGNKGTARLEITHTSIKLGVFLFAVRTERT